MLQTSVFVCLLGVFVQTVYGSPGGPPIGFVQDLCKTMNPDGGHGPSQATGPPPYAISLNTQKYSAGAQNSR